MPIVASNVQYRQLSGKSRTALNPKIINVHTMVGTLEGTESYFSGSGRPYSHFGVPGAGQAWQWQDLAFRAASDLDGNSISISIETEDRGPGFPDWSGSDVPRWTDVQAETLAQLIAWLCVRFGIPPVLVPDSLPGRVGPSYHRLGIDPWRVPNGIRYSSAYGKVCPGDRRINQLRDEVIPRVNEIITGVVPPEEDDDMPALLVRVSDDGSYWGINPVNRWYYATQSQINIDLWFKLIENRNDQCKKSDIIHKYVIGPSPWSEDVPLGQLVDFVNDPDGDGWWLLFGTAWRWHITEESVLNDFRVHWRARGYNVNVQTWTEADLRAVPIADDVPGGVGPGPDLGDLSITFTGTGRATPVDQ